VPGGRVSLALAAWLCLPRLRRAESLGHQDPYPLPVHVLPPADLADRRHDLRFDQGAATHLVSHHVPSDAEQGRDRSATSRPPSPAHTAPSAKSTHPRYLAEFEYRFNRRYDLAAMMPRLGWATVRTPPMPYRLLKLAAVHA
jgi:hypothetical protein